jgi:outer membrane biosynthesis protein TonB
MAKKKSVSLFVSIATELNEKLGLKPPIDTTAPDDDIRESIRTEVDVNTSKNAQLFQDDPLEEKTWKFLKKEYGIERTELPKQNDQTQKELLGAEDEHNENVTPTTPKADKPKAEKPKAEKPKAEKPKADKPKAEKPKAEKPKAEKPKAEKPKAEKEKKVFTPRTPKKYLQSREGSQTQRINAMLAKGATKRELLDMLENEFNFSERGKKANSRLEAHFNSLRIKERDGKVTFTVKGDRIYVKPVQPEK